jgi:mRNA-degrading endonuclease RelE of RelBE toxin-antitoxin system
MLPEEAFPKSRYVVMNQNGGWQIRNAHRHVTATFPSKAARKPPFITVAHRPTPPGSKKLQGVMDGENPVYRARQGDYRILYSVRGVIIVILDIDHRKDVYR